MSQPTLFGPEPEEPAKLPPAKMPYDAPAAPVALLRSRSRPCSACGAMICFPLVAKKVKGAERINPMPVDVEPDPEGTVHIWMESRSRVMRGHVFGRKADRVARQDLHNSHFATCTDPGRFRQRGDH